MKWMIDYKTCQNLADKIESFIPNRIDIYYDNVGGELLDVKISLNNIEYDDPFSYFCFEGCSSSYGRSWSYFSIR